MGVSSLLSLSLCSDSCFSFLSVSLCSPVSFLLFLMSLLFCLFICLSDSLFCLFLPFSYVLLPSLSLFSSLSFFFCCFNCSCSFCFCSFSSRSCRAAALVNKHARGKPVLCPEGVDVAGGTKYFETALLPLQLCGLR